MGELEPGLYEALVTNELAAQLESLDRLTPEQRDLGAAEAPDRIASHISRQIERALRGVPEADRLGVGTAVARDLLTRLAGLTDDEPQDLPVDPVTVLHSILGTRPDGTPSPIVSPLIPLLDTTLLTNAKGEPSLWNQLISEIRSSDRIDVVMAFIRLSGIRRSLECEHPTAHSGSRVHHLRPPRRRASDSHHLETPTPAFWRPRPRARSRSCLSRQPPGQTSRGRLSFSRINCQRSARSSSS